jgi:hypothetical protein
MQRQFDVVIDAMKKAITLHPFPNFTDVTRRPNHLTSSCLRIRETVELCLEDFEKLR